MKTFITLTALILGAYSCFTTPSAASEPEEEGTRFEYSFLRGSSEASRFKEAMSRFEGVLYRGETFFDESFYDHYRKYSQFDNGETIKEPVMRDYETFVEGVDEELKRLAYPIDGFEMQTRNARQALNRFKIHQTGKFEGRLIEDRKMEMVIKHSEVVAEKNPIYSEWLPLFREWKKCRTLLTEFRMRSIDLENSKRAKLRDLEFWRIALTLGGSVQYLNSLFQTLLEQPEKTRIPRDYYELDKVSVQKHDYAVCVSACPKYFFDLDISVLGEFKNNMIIFFLRRCHNAYDGPPHLARDTEKEEESERLLREVTGYCRRNDDPELAWDGFFNDPFFQVIENCQIIENEEGVEEGKEEVEEEEEEGESIVESRSDPEDPRHQLAPEALVERLRLHRFASQTFQGNKGAETERNALFNLLVAGQERQSDEGEPTVKSQSTLEDLRRCQYRVMRLNKLVHDLPSYAKEAKRQALIAFEAYKVVKTKQRYQFDMLTSPEFGFGTFDIYTRTKEDAEEKEKTMRMKMERSYFLENAVTITERIKDQLQELNVKNQCSIYGY